MNYATYSVCNLTILLCNELLLPKVLLLGIGNTLKLGKKSKYILYFVYFSYILSTVLS